MKSLPRKNKTLSASLADEKLVSKAVKGDDQAREELAVPTYQRVKRLVYLAYGPKNDVDDVVQIAMVTIFRDLPNLRKVNRFPSWIDTVVYNVVRSHGRRRILSASIFCGLEVTNEDNRHYEITPEDENIGDQLFNCVQHHIQKINYKKRTAAVMSIFFGYVDSEIATMMGCSTETAKKRVQHGRKELLEHLSKDIEVSELIKEASQ